MVDETGTWCSQWGTPVGRATVFQRVQDGAHFLSTAIWYFSIAEFLFHGWESFLFIHDI